MIERFLFLSPIPFHDRDFQKFGLQILTQSGLQVEVWNLQPFLVPALKAKEGRLPPVVFPGYRRFETRQMFEEALGRECPATTVALCMVGFAPFSRGSFRLYRALARFRIPYAVLTSNGIPCEIPVSSHPLGSSEPGRRGTSSGTLSGLISRFAALFVKIQGKTLRDLFLSFLPRLPLGWLGITPPLVAFNGGEMTFYASYPITGRTEILWAHALDYDEYLRIRELPPNRPAPFGVFLDEFYPFHPDFVLLNRTPPATAERYYPTVRAFLARLEKACGFPFLIAAHPRSDYEQRPDLYGGRPLIRGETAALIRDSRVVVNSYSTAINYVVLFRKPVIFVTTDELDQHGFGPKIAAMAAWLDKRPINMDRPDGTPDLQQELSQSPTAYDHYRQSFIKRDGTPEKPFWQIVADSLKNHP